jgi:hypothetical protein
MNPADVCTAITTTLGTIDGVHLYDYADDSPNSPSFMVIPRLISDMSLGILSTATFTILGLAASTATKDGHNRICGWLSDDGDQSVGAAIEADNTFGGAVSSARVVEASYEPAVVLPDGRRYFGARWTVEVFE